MKKDKKRENDSIKIAKVIIGVLLILLGAFFIVAFFWQLFDGVIMHAFGSSNGYYFPLIWGILLILFPVIGAPAIILGIRLILGKTNNNVYIAILVFMFFTEIILPRIISPQIYLSNWNGITELVDTAVEEYTGFDGNEEIQLHTHTMYGDKMTEQSKRLQRDIDTQADSNMLAAYVIGVVSTAFFFAILMSGRKTKK